MMTHHHSKVHWTLGTAALRRVAFSSIFLASSFFYISSLVHDRQAAEDNKEQFFGIIRLA
jgi:hypothetical protein